MDASLSGTTVRISCCSSTLTGLSPTQYAVPPGSCVEIFTGAEMPADCDAVEMIERTEREENRVVFERLVPPAQHVSHLGEILGQGRTVLTPPRRLSAADLSVLASVGCDPTPVFARVRVSVLTTGDELVPATQTPGAGQIREGNTLFLAAACERLGCEVRRPGIVPDDPAALETAFRAALEEGDALVTTGGVSVGKYDLVGATFERIGVEPVLHKVAIKPGKPIWFGMRGAQPVFGLPGNPVSSLLGFEVFVRPALARLSGAGPAEEQERIRNGRWLGAPARSRGRQVNLPARVRSGADGIDQLEPVPFRGSADVVAGSEADALVIVPADSQIATGELVARGSTRSRRCCFCRSVRWRSS